MCAEVLKGINKGNKSTSVCVHVCARVLLFALSFVMTNGSYLFPLKLFLNTNEAIHPPKNTLAPPIYLSFACESLQIPLEASGAL